MCVLELVFCDVKLLKTTHIIKTKATSKLCILKLYAFILLFISFVSVCVFCFYELTYSFFCRNIQVDFWFLENKQIGWTARQKINEKKTENWMKKYTKHILLDTCIKWVFFLSLSLSFFLALATYWTLIKCGNSVAFLICGMFIQLLGRMW